jgi:phosphohistidine phosphatase
MLTLLVLRHAKSSWGDPALPDHDRPLNARGEKDAPRMAHLVCEQGLAPALILSSTAARALATAQAVQAAAGPGCELRPLDGLYAAGPQAYVEALARLGEFPQRVMVVGHNPDLEELVEALTGEAAEMPTAALAQIELPLARWSELAGEFESPPGRLVNRWIPKDEKKKH